MTRSPTFNSVLVVTDIEVALFAAAAAKDRMFPVTGLGVPALLISRVSAGVVRFPTTRASATSTEVTKASL
jgi:hypothetical protein